MHAYHVEYVYTFVLLYKSTLLFYSVSFFPRLINGDLKGHPLASRMYMWFVHNKRTPHVWLSTTTYCAYDSTTTI